MLKKLKQKTVEKIVGSIPSDWDVNKTARKSLLKLITERAKFVADDIENKLFDQKEFNFDNAEESEP